MQGTSKLRAAVGVAAPTTVLARVEVFITRHVLLHPLTCYLYDCFREREIFIEKYVPMRAPKFIQVLKNNVSASL